jgi:hypothetical protein
LHAKIIDGFCSTLLQAKTVLNTKKQHIVIICQKLSFILGIFIVSLRYSFYFIDYFLNLIYSQFIVFRNKKGKTENVFETLYIIKFFNRKRNNNGCLPL